MITEGHTPLPAYLLAAIAEFDEASERRLDTGSADTECTAAFEKMKEALGRAIIEAEGVFEP